MQKIQPSEGMIVYIAQIPCFAAALCVCSTSVPATFFGYT